MDIAYILQKPEFKELYDFSKKIFVPHEQFKYKNCISLNFFEKDIYSVKLYFATFFKCNKDLIGDYFNYHQVDSLYNLWDIENLDNKGLSFCIKYYPAKDVFKKQIHCKTRIGLAFKNLAFTNNNCRYGIGVEDGEVKIYGNFKDRQDKIAISKYFNKPQLSFFEELEYCESKDSSKVIASYSSSDKELMCDLITKESLPEVYSFLNNIHTKYKIRARNIGFYNKHNIKSYYLYSEKTDNGIDTYKTFLENL
ncbi:MAG: hypothetical protein EBX41_08035 [Chitinophagia bacterium]|nr:hypothetical protein [Chitinophagia bacterium]